MWLRKIKTAIFEIYKVDGAKEINICAVELMKLETRNSCAGNKKEIVNIYVIFVYEQLCKVY